MINEVFIEVLHNLSVRQPEPQSQIVCPLIAPHRRQHPGGAIDQQPALDLWLATPTQGGPGFEALVRQVATMLKKLNHPSGTQIAEGIIGCVVGIKHAGKDRLDLLNSTLATHGKADVSHFFILPVNQDTKELLIRGYRLGNIRVNVIQSRCQRAQSDFWEIYGARYNNSIAFESPERSRPVIDFLSPGLATGWGATIQRLVLNYFTHISRAYFDLMWEEFQEETRVHAAFDCAGIDVENLRSELGRFAQQVTIFLGVTKDAGYVLPEQKTMECVLQDDATNLIIRQRFDELTKAYDTDKIGSSEIGRTIKEYAGFVVEAKRLLAMGRPNDASLYAIIAIEYLFSEKGNTTQAVSNRSGLVGFRGMNLASWQAGRDEIKDLYNLRSQFVHAGCSVSGEEAARMVEWAREILRAILLLHKSIANPEAFSLDNWKKKLDAIIAASHAQIHVDAAVLEEN